MNIMIAIHCARCEAELERVEDPTCKEQPPHEHYRCRNCSPRGHLMCSYVSIAVGDDEPITIG